MARRIRERIKRIARKDTVEKALKDEIIAGVIVGVINNAIHGRQFIDIQTVMQKATRMDLTNPLIFIVLGKVLKIPALGAIGAFRLVNPAQPQTQITEEITEEIYEQKVYLH